MFLAERRRSDTRALVVQTSKRYSENDSTATAAAHIFDHVDVERTALPMLWIITEEYKEQRRPPWTHSGYNKHT